MTYTRLSLPFPRKRKSSLFKVLWMPSDWPELTWYLGAIPSGNDTHSTEMDSRFRGNDMWANEPIL
jgi:hypothetical protein